jgi:hypothetical protein
MAGTVKIKKYEEHDDDDMHASLVPNFICIQLCLILEDYEQEV